MSITLETELFIEADIQAQKLLANLHFEEFNELRAKQYEVLKMKYLRDTPPSLDTPPVGMLSP